MKVSSLKEEDKGEYEPPWSQGKSPGQVKRESPMAERPSPEKTRKQYSPQNLKEESLTPTHYQKNIKHFYTYLLMAKTGQ